MKYMLRCLWPDDEVPPGTNETGPSNPEIDFHTRFRMPVKVFRTLNAGAVWHFRYLRKGLLSNTTEKASIAPILKVIVALRGMSHSQRWCCVDLSVSEEGTIERPNREGGNSSSAEGHCCVAKNVTRPVDGHLR